MPGPQVVFISFVGTDPETDVICDLVNAKLAKQFGAELCVYLGDPFAMWDKIHIDGCSKSTLSAEERFWFRWGLLKGFLPGAESAFAGGARFFTSRRLGFDLVAGAQACGKNDGILGLHHHFVDMFVRMRPLYVVTEQVSPWLREQLDEYFAPDSGQRHIVIPSGLSREQKVDRIVLCAEQEFEGIQVGLPN